MLRFITTISLMIFSLVSQAVTVDGLYEAKVPVESKSQEVWEDAAKRALQEVLTKVSGHLSVLTVEELAAVNPRRMLASYGYLWESGTESLVLQAEFDSKQINKFLQDKGIAVWGANRPQLLFWVQVVDDGYDKILAQSTGPVAEHLLVALESAGLPGIIPRRAREGMSVFPDTQSQIMNADSIIQVSRGYEQNGQVVARIINRGDSWRLTGFVLHQGANHQLESSYPSYNDALVGLVKEVAPYLASRYAVVESLSSSPEEQVIVINGIDSYRNYQEVVSVLKSIPGVEAVNLVSALDDSASLGLLLRVGWRQVLNNLSLESRFKPTGVSGVYDWND